MFKVGDLVITTDGTIWSEEPQMWDRSEEALALVVKPPSQGAEERVQVHYLTGPCSGDMVWEFEDLFALVSPSGLRETAKRLAETFDEPEMEMDVEEELS